MKRVALVCAGVVVAGMFTGQAAQAKPYIPKNFLLYEKQARADAGGEHWILVEGGTNEDVWNAQCRPASLKGWSARRDLTYDTEIGGGEKTNAIRGEQVFVFSKASKARAMMAGMRKLMKGCAQITASAPRIGDEAVGGVLKVKAKIPQTQKFVAVRRGAAVALYWDLANAARPLRSMARHERDARRMAGKLCAIGGC
ncbi:hypothetical protein [Nonomuraea endophytica]|uniref:hypothetical protein n=1 Tax=Nonomuraea endophytica TaxID=714136 RepID=UPI0037CC27DE